MEKGRNAVNTLILTSLLVLWAGCATSQYRNEPTITLQANEKSIDDTTFLYAPHAVCLETNDEALIARVDKVIEWNQTLYILDKRKKQIVAFDTNGKHKYTLRRVGGGQGEYGSIIDASIDKKKNELVLLVDPSALLRFDTQGNFINSQKLPAYYNSMVIDNNYTYLENDTYANDRPTNYSITILHDGNKTELLEPLKELAPYCFIGGHQLSGSSPTMFTRKFDQTIYEIVKEEINPLYHIDFSKETFPEEAKDKVYDCKELNSYTIRNRFVYLMTDVINAQKNLVFKTNLPGGIYILSKTDSVLSKYNNVFNSKYKFPLPKYTPIVGEEEAICFIVPASSLLNLRTISNKNPNANISPELLELLSNKKEEDNPIIFYYKLK